MGAISLSYYISCGSSAEKDYQQSKNALCLWSRHLDQYMLCQALKSNIMDDVDVHFI
jgi:hypothetical protein